MPLYLKKTWIRKTIMAIVDRVFLYWERTPKRESFRLKSRDVLKRWGVGLRVISTGSLSQWWEANRFFTYSLVSFSCFFGQEDFGAIFFITSMQPQPQSSSLWLIIASIMPAKSMPSQQLWDCCLLSFCLSVISIPPLCVLLGDFPIRWCTT